MFQSFIIWFLITNLIFLVFSEDILVRIPHGTIRGRKIYSQRGISFYGFMQVPYAKPPVESLRFKSPVPADKWSGILDATAINSKICYQLPRYSNAQEHETEDCLYLNVYTPKYPNASVSLPVLYFIHGGGFIAGYGTFMHTGPHYFMENGVVVVTINYRIGPFGFLTTGDKVIPGNFGLKDQILGLEWVRDNIKYFGGDPTKVSIMGSSAGSASVSYLMLSPKAKGLFRGAIAKSGSSLCPWAYQRNYKQYAQLIVQRITGGKVVNATSEQILRYLQNASAPDIMKYAPPQTDFQRTTDEQIFQGFWYTPVVELEHPDAVLTENMYEAFEKGHATKVPLLTGICSEETIGMGMGNRTAFKELMKYHDSHLDTLVNWNMHITNITQKKIVGAAIRKLYTEGMFQDHLGKSIRFHSDMCFDRGIITNAKLQSHLSDVYFYQFAYPPGPPIINGAERIGHVADNQYLWVYNNISDLNKRDKSFIRTSEIYRALLTNFVKTLNPTPVPETLLGNITWPKLTRINFQYLNINASLSIKSSNPRGDVILEWDKLYEKYGIRPFDSY